MLDGVTIDDKNLACEGVLVQGRRGSTIVRNSTISCGSVALGFQQEHGASFIEGSTFHCPGATAAWVFHGPARLHRNVVEGILELENEGTGGEYIVIEGSVLLGGAHVYYSSTILRNTVVTAPLQLEYADLAVQASVVSTGACGVSSRASSVAISYSDFYGNTANGCGVGDPVGTNGNF